MKMDLKKVAKQLKLDIPTIYFCLKHKNTPLLAKAIALFTVCYALSPIDLIPDFLGPIGYIDDLLLLPLFIVIVKKMIPNDVFQQCQEQAKTASIEKKWYYSLVIIGIWIVVGYVFFIKIVK